MQELRVIAALIASGISVFGGAPEVHAVIDQYCTGCHNSRAKIGGLSLQDLSLEKIPAQAETWEKVIGRLRAGSMPPAGSKRPDVKVYRETASWLEAQIDQAAARAPWVGRPALHRLNRAEYTNAIRDIFGLEADIASLLPPDDAAFGFDNNADVLGVSPSLQERYLAAAAQIASLVVGDMKLTPGSKTWRIPQDLSQNRHIDGLPLGTVGGTSVRYTFPLDAKYEFQAKLYRTNLNIVRGLQTRNQVEFSLDGKRIHLAMIGGPEDLASLFTRPTETGDDADNRLRIRVPVTAGPHTMTVAFVEGSQSAEPVRLEPFLRSSVDNFDWAGHPHLRTLTVAGPFEPTGVGNSPTRLRLYNCSPEQETQCAQRTLSRVIASAYRQSPSEADVARAMQFFETARRTGNFDAGMRAALERILASPKFVFRAEPSTGRLSGSELASRLSFFLWSSVPDAELLDLGISGDLAAQSDRQLRRMLADPRASALVTNFAGQWLQLRNLRTFQPNTDRFPDFDDNLRHAFQRETELLFQSIVTENRSVLELLTADYTFVNDRLAQHYGIPGVRGSHFRRVPVTDPRRRGLLGHGSILALTSHAERTSPVVRGKWILENLLGQVVPPPPPDVPLLPEPKAGERPKTMREQMAAHRENPVCAACHRPLDPIGFALENFNAVGAWRDQDASQPIDASGELVNGQKISGVVELRAALLSEPQLFATTVTKKLLTYALGRGLDYRDMPQVRAIVAGAARDNYRTQSLLRGIIESAPFQRNGESR